MDQNLCFSFRFQLKDLQVFTVIRAIFQLSDEIPCISAVVVALMAEVYYEHPTSIVWLDLRRYFIYFLFIFIFNFWSNR